ncbi:hypothetical protein EHQ13_16495 [Leptospira gomenensis]|nr:hypothetical protein [Leptospira gomenensis]TGK42615.1 hypothetical protein EHQ07_14475 [Leptospira gomenensis]TGK55863.1 hypothetical protein EHQ13_16495 [Leptospira gomenensis]
MSTETLIYKGTAVHIYTIYDILTNYDPHVKNSLIKQSEVDSPLFYDKSHYINNPPEYVAIDTSHIIEKEYVTNAYNIDSMNKLDYFRFVYFKVCPEVKSISFWNKIKAVQEDKLIRSAIYTDIKKHGVSHLIQIIDKADRMEDKRRYYDMLNNLLQEKAALLLKKTFNEYYKYSEHSIIYMNGKDTGYYLKDLFRLSLSKNPNSGVSLEKDTFYLKQISNQEGEFELHYKMRESGEYLANGPEIYFKVFNGKIVLSGLRNGIRKNEPGWELAALQLLKMFDNYVEIDSFNFSYLNTQLIDSLK